MSSNTDTEIQRASRGRFAPGQSGNPAGGAKRLTAEQRIERAMNTHGVGLLERAFVEAQTDNLVLANLLGFLASCQNASSVHSVALLQATDPASRH
ncbi:hypothetical protein [Azotobacter beijerinckii]|uniref:hypothetical protein n=1 Tax=Azotobacter beijerinckii TaxID=170623 RepID=UPI0029557B33|nr:hypothetical protein [Azotobacter beijerinckii]MDV7210772.1 hypothetical protein [Azotobacter beijerinckii]